jgi:hypothetical protein
MQSIFKRLILVWFWLACEIAQAQQLPKSVCSTVSARKESHDLIVKGELTRKGSDLDSWWALRTESGKVYRLEARNSDQEKSLFEWQNGAVTVFGKLDGKVLSVEVICVQKISRE